MKKLLFALISCVLVLYSCSKDESPKNYSEEIIGTWYQLSYKNNSTDSFIGQEDGTYIRFDNNGHFEFFYSGWGVFNETTIGTYSMNTDFLVELVLEDGTKASIIITEKEGNKAKFQFQDLYAGTYEMEKR